jgi:hypothetical protein
VATLAGSDGAVVRAQRFGGTNVDRVWGLAADPAGSVYLTGQFSGVTNLDPAGGIAGKRTASGSADAFVLKLDVGGTYAWAAAFTSRALVQGRAVATDGTHVYAAGRYYGNVWIPTSGLPAVMGNLGGADVFITKLDAATGLAEWARRLGGAGYDDAYAIAPDGNGGVYTTGEFAGTVDFDPGPTFNLTSVGGSDVFVSRLDSSGGFGWACRLGGAGGDVGMGIAVDALKGIHLAGRFQGSGDFDPGPGAYTLSGAGSQTGFLVRLPDPAIGGRLFVDADDDGILGSGEAGIAGVEVELFLDDGDGVFDAAGDALVATAITESDGRFRFLSLPPGRYWLRVAGSMLAQRGLDPARSTVLRPVVLVGDCDLWDVDLAAYTQESTVDRAIAAWIAGTAVLADA